MSAAIHSVFAIHAFIPWMSIYLVVLASHFFYAGWVMRQGWFSLAIGRVQSPLVILPLLLLLNGFSLSVFFVQNPRWSLFNLGVHSVLAVDEIIRMYKVPLRWPFFVNHLLFSGVIAAADSVGR